MKLTATKVGDVFAVTIGNYKKYFQYVANDLSQLNSDVIRAFKTKYGVEEQPDIDEIIKDEVQFYAHCVTKLGLKMGLWSKIGNMHELGDTNIWFRDTDDYGRAPKDGSVKVSKNWYIWKIGGEFQPVGELNDKTREAFVGLVINPKGIIELLKGNRYPPLYPN